MLVDHRPTVTNAVDARPIEPLPSWVWYQDMADFADRIRPASGPQDVAVS